MCNPDAARDDYSLHAETMSPRRWGSFGRHGRNLGGHFPHDLVRVGSLATLHRVPSTTLPLIQRPEYDIFNITQTVHRTVHEGMSRVCYCMQSQTRDVSDMYIMHVQHHVCTVHVFVLRARGQISQCWATCERIGED